MAGVLLRRGKFGYREEEARSRQRQTGVMLSQAKEHQGFPANTRSQEEPRKNP